MSDLISRQAAIDAADRADYTGLPIEDVKKVTDAVIKELKQLPSTEPERKTAKWESISDVIWYCSECKYAHSRSNYCPHCGAKMIKENS